MAAKKVKLTEQEKSEIALLRASNEMYEKTKREALEKGSTDNQMRQISEAQEDIIAKIAKISTEEAEKVKKSNVDVSTEQIEQQNSHVNVVDLDDRQIDMFSLDNQQAPNAENVDTASLLTFNEWQAPNTDVFNNIKVDDDVQYDVIALPSNGEQYKNKQNRIAVAYLTAYDENFLTSPNLYQDGLVIDFLLKNKVLDKGIDVENLLPGDVDAITVFLRATSYGSDYPVEVYDDDGNRFEGVADLTTIKVKDFNLKSDKDGYFDFECPITKDKIKFKFLTRKDVKLLDRVTNLENKNTKAQFVKTKVSDIKTVINSEPQMNAATKKKLEDEMSDILKWADTISDANSVPINHMITNRLEMSIISVNGNGDREYIKKYVKRMPAMDSLTFRKYLLENEPGMNFEVEIKKPESLGGGSVKRFLEWGDDVFLHIAEL